MKSVKKWRSQVKQMREAIFHAKDKSRQVTNRKKRDLEDIKDLRQRLRVNIQDRSIPLEEVFEC